MEIVVFFRAETLLSSPLMESSIWKSAVRMGSCVSMGLVPCLLAAKLVVIGVVCFCLTLAGSGMSDRGGHGAWMESEYKKKKVNGSS